MSRSDFLRYTILNCQLHSEFGSLFHNLVVCIDRFAANASGVAVVVQTEGGVSSHPPSHNIEPLFPRFVSFRLLVEPLLLIDSSLLCFLQFLVPPTLALVKTKISSVSIFMRSWRLVFRSNPFFLNLEAFHSALLRLLGQSHFQLLPMYWACAPFTVFCTFESPAPFTVQQRARVDHSIKDCTCRRTSTVF